MSTETTTVVPNSILCSLPEQPREVRCDLHPTRPWVLASPDTTSADSDARYAAIFDYRRRTLVFAIHPEDQSAESADVNAAAAASASAAAASGAASGEPTATTPTGVTPSSPVSTTAVLQRKNSVPGNSSSASAIAAAAAAAVAVAAAEKCRNTDDSDSSAENTTKARSPSESAGSVTPRPLATPRTPSKSRAVPATVSHNVQKSEQQKAPGSLRFVKFFDSDVRAWKRLSECSVISSAAGAQAAAEQLMSSSGSYVIVVYDTRVVLFNYVNGTKSVTFLSELRGVPITALEVFSSRNWVAFGGNDGTVRLWDVDRREIVRVLSGGHKSSADVDCLLSFTDDRTGAEYIVSGASDGMICLWNITTGKMEGAACKAHDGGVNGLVLRAADHVIVTAGDKGLAEWSYSRSGFSEVRRAPSKRTAFGSISGSLFSHPQFPADCILTLKKDSSEIFATNFDQSDYRPLTTFNDIHGATKKDVKGSKIYSFTVHPATPEIFCISTAKGAFVVKFEELASGLPIVFDTTNGGQRVFYEKGCNIVVKTIGANDKTTTDQVIASGLHSENVELLLTNRGQTLFCLNPTSQTYTIINRNNSSNKWTPGEERPYRVSLAVANGRLVESSTKDRFAVLESSGAPLTQSRRGGNPASQSMKLVLYQQSGAAIKAVSETPAKEIKTLFSGQLLGVVTGSSDAKENTLQFYNWSSLDDSGKVGGPLPAPERVVWDHEKPQVALIYKHSFVLYRLENKTELSLIMSASESVSSLVWSDMRVYTASRGYIKCYFYDVPDMPIVIACNMGECSASSEEAPSPHFPLPLGSFELLGENTTDLLVLDYNRRLHRYPTASNSFLSALIHATMGHATQALEIAKNLHPHFHEAMALFLVRRDFVREVLQLDGLSVWWKLQYCISNRLLSDAIPLLKKTAQEFTKKKSPKQKERLANGVVPFIELYDLTQSFLPSQDQSLVHPTKDELMTAAAELAALCRDYVKPVDVKVATSITETGETNTIRALARTALDCVSEVDPPRYFMLTALHLALTEAPASELVALSSKIQSSFNANTQQQETERLKDVLLFVNACTDKPDLILKAWGNITQEKKS